MGGAWRSQKRQRSRPALQRVSERGFGVARREPTACQTACVVTRAVPTSPAQAFGARPRRWMSAADPDLDGSIPTSNASSMTIPPPSSDPHRQARHHRSTVSKRTSTTQG
uniref:Uncharacterized protein n=1 Tax=Oryza glumipatula TaxID=40148 RepID=A0A0E0B8G9_9ORYZ